MRISVWRLLISILVSAASTAQGKALPVEFRVVPVRFTQTYDEEGLLSAQMLKATFRNVSDTVLALSTNEIGDVCPDYVEREGQRLPSHKRSIYFNDGPIDASKDPLVAVEPGASIVLDLHGLSCVILGEQHDVSVTFGELTPGRYRTRFFYQYAGPSWGRKDIFRGRVYSNVVSFEIVGPTRAPEK